MTIDHLLRDVRYGWRGLWQSRAFAATSVATLAVGLALVTVVFTIFNAYVLRPFAVRDPYSLYSLVWLARDAGSRLFSWNDFRQLGDRRGLFDGVVAERSQFVAGGAGRLAVTFVSGNYFETIGARVALGRPLAPFDATTPGGAAVAVLSHQAWERLFDADPAVLGRRLTLNGEPFVVAGAAAEEFAGMSDTPADLWTPLTMYPAVMKQDLFGPADVRELGVTVRLRAGVTPEQAAAALEPFVQASLDRQDAVRVQLRAQATPEPLTLELVATLSPVFAAFALVLAAAAANVSNIMLARANTRHREIAVRLSLGATRARVVSQLLTEGVLISVLAGAAGLGLTALLLQGGTRMLFATLPPTAAALIRVVPLVVDQRVFAFTFIVAAATTVIFALVPALQATRTTLTPALRGEPAQGVRRSRLRNGLVTAQVTISLILLVVAGTVAHNTAILNRIELGFATDGVLSVNQRGSRGTSLIAEAAAALRADPRVATVAVTNQNPLFGQLWRAPLSAGIDGALLTASYMFVSADYFDLLEIPLTQGRAFRRDEATADAAVAVVSESTARALWPGQNAVGRTIRMRLERRVAQRPEAGPIRPPDPVDVDLSVVGVARDAISGFVFEGASRPQIYLPTHDRGRDAAALLVRGHAGAPLRPDDAQALLRPIHFDPLTFEVMPLDEARDMQMFPVRVTSWIGSVLSMITLVLSVAGLYGVVSYGMSQRTREIGIRMALGATAGAVVRLVMAQSVRLVAVGTAIGVTASVGVLATLRSIVRFDNVNLLDGGAVVAGVAAILAAAVAASFVPARRATRIDPAGALRAE